MSEKKVAYLLMYDRDDGASESWSLFYTPIEAFETKELRDARIAYLRSRDRELDFETRDLEMTDPNEFYESEEDEDEGED